MPPQWCELEHLIHEKRLSELGWEKRWLLGTQPACTYGEVMEKAEPGFSRWCMAEKSQRWTKIERTEVSDSSQGKGSSALGQLSFRTWSSEMLEIPVVFQGWIKLWATSSDLTAAPLLHRMVKQTPPEVPSDLNDTMGTRHVNCFRKNQSSIKECHCLLSRKTHLKDKKTWRIWYQPHSYWWDFVIQVSMLGGHGADLICMVWNSML